MFSHINQITQLLIFIWSSMYLHCSSNTSLEPFKKYQLWSFNKHQLLCDQQYSFQDKNIFYWSWSSKLRAFLFFLMYTAFQSFPFRGE